MTQSSATIQAASSPEGVYLIVTTPAGLLQPVRLTAERALGLALQLTRAAVECQGQAAEKAERN